MTISRTTWLSLVFTAVACVSSTLPSTSLAYNPVAPGATPTPGPGWAVPHNLTPSTVITPDMVWGKEYSHDRDRPVAGKVTLWDGTGRTAAGRNYRPNPWLPEGTPRDIEGDIDALANSRDILFHELLDDQTAMVFSHDNEIVNWDGSYANLPSGGPLPVWSGVSVTPFWQIGGAGELTRSLPGSFALDRWATRADIDSKPTPTPLPVDVDGLELWGDEPDPHAPLPGDADKYSLANDAQSGVSVWNEDGTSYLSHNDVVDAVQELLGTAPNRDLIDLDAMMLFDGQGDTQDSFDFCRGLECNAYFTRGVDQEGNSLRVETPFGFAVDPTIPDAIVFSIKQIATPTGYYATGSELFVLNDRGGVSWLDHGGETWDRAFAEQRMGISIAVDGMDVAGVIDINALEAIGNLPTSAVGLPGDVNNDGQVNLIDLDILGANFGSSGVGPSGGDLNSDGVVDLLDLDLLGANFGAGGSGPSAAVPEPGAMMLLACGAGLAMVRRR